ncbi:unnamed protein product [Hapterophycus canaliculatus]
MMEKNEVIGWLGGWYDSINKILYVQTAVPCKEDQDVSSGERGRTEVSMCQTSSLDTSEAIREHGMQLVGWYHSHPKFVNDPSPIDVENHQLFQATGSAGAWVGLIVGRKTSPSEFRWFRNAPAERVLRDSHGEPIGTETVLCPMLLRTTLASSITSPAAAAAGAAATAAEVAALTAAATAAPARPPESAEPGTASSAPTRVPLSPRTRTPPQRTPPTAGKPAVESGALGCLSSEKGGARRAAEKSVQGGNGTGEGGGTGGGRERAVGGGEALELQQRQRLRQQQRKRQREVVRQQVSAKDVERRRMKAARLMPGRDRVFTGGDGGDGGGGGGEGVGGTAFGAEDSPAVDVGSGRGAGGPLPHAPPQLAPADACHDVDPSHAARLGGDDTVSHALPVPRTPAVSSGGGASGGASGRGAYAVGGEAWQLGMTTLEAIAATARDPPLVMSEEVLEVLIGKARGGAGTDGGGSGGAVGEDGDGVGTGGYGPRLDRVVEALTSLGRFYSGMTGRAGLSNGAKAGVPVLEKLARSLAQTVQHMELNTSEADEFIQDTCAFLLACFRETDVKLANQQRGVTKKRKGGAADMASQPRRSVRARV